MSLAEIRAEIAKLTPEEKAELRDELAPNPLEDDELMDEVVRRHEEMERGINVVTREQLYERLRAAGFNV